MPKIVLPPDIPVKNNPNLIVVTKETPQEVLYALLTPPAWVVEGNLHQALQKSTEAILGR